MKKKLFALIATLGVAFAVLVPAGAMAYDPYSEICKTNGAGGSAACTTPKGNPVVSTINKVSTVITIIAVPAAVIILAIAGIMFITSGGDSGKVAAARRTVIYTAVGLAVIIFARVIIGFVITNVYK